jgi:hypothetical protein
MDDLIKLVRTYRLTAGLAERIRLAEEICRMIQPDLRYFVFSSVSPQVIIRCPCGCGDDLLINLDKRAGPAWRYYRNQYGLSLYPSYWRDSECGSHFIIWNSYIYWCYGWESEESDTWSVSQSVEDAVWKAMPDSQFINYEDIADRLELIPWEALQACRQLVGRGLVIANTGRKRGEFRKKPQTSNFF